MIKKSGFAATAVAAGMVVAFPNVAVAGSHQSGGYLALMYGGSSLDDSTVDGQRTDLKVKKAAVELDDSDIWGVAIGHTFENPFRLEGEVTFQTFDVKKIGNDDSPGTMSTATGDIDVVGVTANVFYDYRTSIGLTPFIGLGAGGVYAEANDVTRSGRSALNEAAVAPLYVGQVGVSYNLFDSIDLTAGYRFQMIHTLDGAKDGHNNASTDITTATATTTKAETDDIYIHSLTVGLRYTF